MSQFSGHRIDHVEWKWVSGVEMDQAGYDPERDDFDDPVDTPGDYEGDEYLGSTGGIASADTWLLRVRETQKALDIARSERDWAMRGAYRSGYSIREITAVAGYRSPAFIHKIVRNARPTTSAP